MSIRIWILHPDVWDPLLDPTVCGWFHHGCVSDAIILNNSLENFSTRFLMDSICVFKSNGPPESPISNGPTFYKNSSSVANLVCPSGCLLGLLKWPCVLNRLHLSSFIVFRLQFCQALSPACQWKNTSQQDHQPALPFQSQGSPSLIFSCTWHSWSLFASWNSFSSWLQSLLVLSLPWLMLLLGLLPQFLLISEINVPTSRLL